MAKRKVNKTKNTTKPVAKCCFVNITVNTKNPIEEVYLIGNTKNLGAWETKKAVKMNKINDNTFTLRKRFYLNTEVEYKVVASKTWGNVEKGIFAEDVENHHFVAEKGHFEDIFVHSFN